MQVTISNMERTNLARMAVLVDHMSPLKDWRIIYLALKQISVLYLALEKLKFPIRRQVKIPFLK